MVMSPLCAVPPTAACKVVMVSASGAVPEIVTVSSTLSIARTIALDQEGIVLGVPTAKFTSSVPEPDPPAVKINFFTLAEAPSPMLTA